MMTTFTLWWWQRWDVIESEDGVLQGDWSVWYQWLTPLWQKIQCCKCFATPWGSMLEFFVWGKNVCVCDIRQFNTGVLFTSIILAFAKRTLMLREAARDLIASQVCILYWFWGSSNMMTRPKLWQYVQNLPSFGDVWLRVKPRGTFFSMTGYLYPRKVWKLPAVLLLFIISCLSEPVPSAGMFRHMSVLSSVVCGFVSQNHSKQLGGFVGAAVVVSEQNYCCISQKQTAVLPLCLALFSLVWNKTCGQVCPDCPEVKIALAIIAIIFRTFKDFIIASLTWGREAKLGMMIGMMRRRVNRQ